eukprot:jgi/Bigna1/125489/aug1.1_g197
MVNQAMAQAATLHMLLEGDLLMLPERSFSSIAADLPKDFKTTTFQPLPVILWKGPQQSWKEEEEAGERRGMHNQAATRYVDLFTIEALPFRSATSTSVTETHTPFSSSISTKPLCVEADSNSDKRGRDSTPITIHGLFDDDHYGEELAF